MRQPLYVRITEQIALGLRLRRAFAERYCREHGWPTDPNALTWDQLMEIRRQPEWKCAGETETADP